MKQIAKGIVILFIGVFITACGNSGSSSKISKSAALELCRGSVSSAIQDGFSSGVSDPQAYRAGERALENCMAGYGYYPQ